MVSLTSKNDHASSSAYQTPSTTSQSSSTTTATESTTSTSPVDPNVSKLLSLVPAGYPSGACTPSTASADSLYSSALAMVSCEQNTDQGGPMHTTYGLFADVSALKGAFDRDIASTHLMKCPNSGPTPTGWHRESSPSVNVGTIACATFQDKPNLMWTNQDNLLLADTYGAPATVEDLFEWWHHHC